MLLQLLKTISLVALGAYFVCFGQACQFISNSERNLDSQNKVNHVGNVPNGVTNPQQSSSNAACEAYWGSRVVFVGRLLKVIVPPLQKARRRNDRDLAQDSLIAYFAVKATYRGNEFWLQGEVKLTIFNEMAQQQQQDLRIGEEYLVYARTPGKSYPPLEASSSAVKHVSQAVADLKYIEEISAPGSTLESLKRVDLRYPDHDEIKLGHWVYPPEAQQAGVSGDVFVLIITDEAGIAKRVETLCGHPMLVGAAEQSARGMRYEPGPESDKERRKVGGVIRYIFFNDHKTIAWSWL